ncbi:hypothetical protein JCM19037_4315 [Geomicrobium sp. JCM 19037]|nr:hypothetical protein JCM19037_4315 [Geomicrobium sp. JCM 19037]
MYREQNRYKEQRDGEKKWNEAKYRQQKQHITNKYETEAQQHLFHSYQLQKQFVYFMLDHTKKD